MSNELTVAIRAAKEGTEVALKHFKNIPPVTIKADNTPVTIADKETEQVIRKHIKKEFPDASFVGEEFGGEFAKKDVWIIDPIDGTKNFIRGIPFWGILIALLKNSEVVVGVSYLPLIDELLYAERGSGAFLNNKKVKVSAIDKLENSTITHTGNPFKFKKPKNVEKLLSTCIHTRGFGDMLSYHLVANGRADINFEFEVKVWDVAPYKVIIEEAGGRITSLDGSPWTVNIHNFVATNGFLHDEVIAILNKKD